MDLYSGISANWDCARLSYCGLRFWYQRMMAKQ